MSSYYTTLNLTTSATEPEIMSAYRRLSLKCHPDKGGDVKAFHQLTDAKDYCLKQLSRPIELRGRLEAVPQQYQTQTQTPPEWAFNPYVRRHHMTPDEMAEWYANTFGTEGDSVPCHLDPKFHSIGFKWAKLVTKAWIRKHKEKKEAKLKAKRAERQRKENELRNAHEADVHAMAERITKMQEELRAKGVTC